MCRASLKQHHLCENAQSATVGMQYELYCIIIGVAPTTFPAVVGRWRIGATTLAKSDLVYLDCFELPYLNSYLLVSCPGMNLHGGPSTSV